jgi:hypothetical protein
MTGERLPFSCWVGLTIALAKRLPLPGVTPDVAASLPATRRSHLPLAAAEQVRLLTRDGAGLETEYIARFGAN